MAVVRSDVKALIAVSRAAYRDERSDPIIVSRSTLIIGFGGTEQQFNESLTDDGALATGQIPDQLDGALNFTA